MLRGYSDGALSADGVVGAYGWLVAVADGQGGLEVLAAGGGSAVADDRTNILLSSTRMEALGLAGGLSYARAWTGRVEWRLDNTGVISSWRKLARAAPSAWAKVSDRDVHGHIELLRSEAAGQWRVAHVRGHAERRKARELWTLDEVGNDAADRVAGRISAAVVQEVRKWDEEVREWQRRVDAGDEEAEVPKPTRRRAAPAVQAWRLATRRPWMLVHEGQEVVGSVRQWLRETMQNAYSLEYLTAQSAGLYVGGAPEVAQVGDTVHIDGEAYEVRQVMGDRAMCATHPEADADEWEVLSVEDVANLLREERGSYGHSPSPDVRLVRDMWVRKGGRARVHAVKFMWGLFACNDLLHRRFGRGGDGCCSACPGERETAWHVIGACGDAQATALRKRWAERMWAEVSAELVHAHSPLDVRVANAVRRLWSLDEEQRLREWAPGMAGPVANAGLDGELQRLLDEVARAGSWSVWMGVFDRGWLQLLQKGGMSYTRARRLTKRLCAVICEFRADIARVRNERQRQVRGEQRARREQELDAAVVELHGRDAAPTMTLEQLREQPWRVRDRYKRRREHEEREAELERERQQLEAERVRVRRARQARERKRRRLADTGRIRLATGDGADLRAMWRGEVRAADVDGMSEERGSSGSDDDDAGGGRGEGNRREATGAGRNLDPGAEARVAAAVRLEEAARRRRLERMRLLEARGMQRRHEARMLRRRGGQREERGRRRRERRGGGGSRGRTKRGGGGGVARRRKRRRIIEDTDSDDDSGDEAAAEGRKRKREDDEGESGERNRLVAGRLVGGPGDERRQAAAAAVRRHRGGGGKRGWVA